MSNGKIILMANQIARNLARGHGDPAKATAEHINSFWDPRMRAQLLEALQTDNAEITETVRAAEPLLNVPKSL